MTLTEFLLARIAEDEAAVEGFWSGDGDPDFMWGPGRIRVECEAKRRIVEQVQREEGLPDLGDPADGAAWVALDQVLRALALPYADHSDYDPGWR